MRVAYTFFIGLFFLTSTAKAAVVSTNVGRVGDWVVTSREVYINHILENLLYKNEDRGKSPPQPTIELEKTKDKNFARETTTVLLESAVYFEAESFGSITPGVEAEINKQLKIAKEEVKKLPYWKKLQVSEKELSLFIKRKVKAKEFLKFKMESARIPITDKEAEEYFRSNRLKFESSDYASFKESIIKYLTQQQMDRRLKDWFDLLQSKYHVRNQLTE